MGAAAQAASWRFQMGAAAPIARLRHKSFALVQTVWRRPPDKAKLKTYAPQPIAS
jgi:hypothetical protein